MTTIKLAQERRQALVEAVCMPVLAGMLRMLCHVNSIHTCTCMCTHMHAQYVHMQANDIHTPNVFMPILAGMSRMLCHTLHT